jgi:hypothetical protein
MLVLILLWYAMWVLELLVQVCVFIVNIRMCWTDYTNRNITIIIKIKQYSLTGLGENYHSYHYFLCH